MNNNEALEMIQEVIDGLKAGGIIDSEIQMNEDTVIIGKGAVLDSIAFVTFFMEAEAKLADKVQKEIYLSIEDIVDLADGKGITIDRLISYIVELSKQ